jgi:carbon storage regulator
LNGDGDLNRLDLRRIARTIERSLLVGGVFICNQLESDRTYQNCGSKETQLLILSRKANQRIVIGENIELIVVAVTGDRVRLGFNAPRSVPIFREEIYRRIQSKDQARDLATAAALADEELPLADRRQLETG